jgi:hypothetical protein
MLIAAEHALVSQATGRDDGTEDPDSDTCDDDRLRVPVSADLLRGPARTWRDALDPDGIEPRAEQARQNRDFWISHTPRGGLHPVGGGVTPDVAALFFAIMDTVTSPHTKPMFLPDDDAAGGDGAAGSEIGAAAGDGATCDANANAGAGGAEGAGTNDDAGTGAHDADDADAADAADATDPVLPPADPRTPGQVRADVFAAMVRSFLGNTAFSTPPPVMITLTGDTYLTGQGTGSMTGITEPVAASDITHATCDGGTQPVWFTPNGAIQALGTPGRFFTAAQRRAIAARDGNTCLDENCDIPATATEAHHVIPDRDGGPTHINNGVLLCWYHHGLIDRGILQIIMINGKPKITTPRWHPRT